ncbi:Amuc_1100 family pilus-like protein [Luteolibacter sp. AS25]|uniref:Amuc_1100 family pilus-like protein n=1 Tax=Luteolibacter sp. AS25 TaxID=3135776 RepID=UPI00398ACBA9
MNWIKSNPFVSILSGITAVICAILAFIAIKSGSKYNELKSSFDESFQNVSKSERSKLYPTTENRAAKTKALADYRENIDELRGLFDKYRNEDLEKISPQDFTVRLKTATSKVTTALEDAGCEVPENFFLGFESYRTKLANSGSTAILDYQLKGFENALLALADARPTELLKIYREPSPEESGQTYEPGENEISRNFGMELTFKGSEASAREFLSALGKTEPNYYIIRCVSVLNENVEPPKVSDASFEKDRKVEAAAPASGNPFGDGFDFSGSEDSGSEESGEGDASAETEVAAPAPEVDTTRILAQVLGSEEIVVFVRFDLTLFSPTEELPKP